MSVPCGQLHCPSGCQFKKPLIPVLAVVTFIPIQVLMGSILESHFMGNQFNLSPIVILISLFFWSYIWGLTGDFLAVPLTAMTRIISSNIDSLQPIAQLISRSGDT
jgi:predicted PurR-regulated permease PerM